MTTVLPSPADISVTTPPPPPPSTQETFAFSADINQLLSLIINTFYSNKDVFLRELISNASDALDKIRYEALTTPEVLEAESSLEIRLKVDKKAGILAIEDTGIGMTKRDLINNLGTIAKSGTKGFMEALQAGADISMIGQFGVGFYSAYLAADRVEVYSKHHSDEPEHVWSSSAGGSFTVDEVAEPTLTRGTRLVLHLKDDMRAYLEERKLRDLVQRHSEFVDFPIQLWVEKTVSKEITDDDESDAEEVAVADGAEDDAPTVEDVDDEESANKNDTKKKTKTVEEVTHAWEHLNSTKPLWMRPADEVTPEEYAAFYKAMSHDWEAHSAVQHFAVEGQLQFKALLFAPSRAPFDMFDSSGDKKKRTNIRLYVRRVFITDESEELLPEYLSFIKGVVDSDDLPLNISRETLQQTKIMRVVRKNLVKKCLEMFATLAEDEDKYAKFYAAFSKNLKLGIHEDATNRAKLAKLLRFHTTTHADKCEVSLDDYVARMAENQKGIYYVTGESVRALEHCPFTEVLRKRGVEVLLMVDPIDEYAVQQLKEYDGHKLICVTKEGLDLGGDEDGDDEAAKASREACEKLCAHVKEVLGDQVEKVVPSQRIASSPCCLVTGEYGWSANMERIMKAQALRDSASSAMMAPKKTLELNATHPIVRAMAAKIAADPSDSTVKDLVWMLFETSLIDSGFSLERPTSFTSRIHRLISLGLDIDDADDDDDDDGVPDSVEEDSASDEGESGNAMEEVD